MDNFNLYAKYYDLLYRDKDYGAEVNYICELLKPYLNTPVSKLLDLGCGTGKHAQLFSEHGYNVDGVDLSDTMIDRAIESFGDNQKLSFQVGDITTFSNGKLYDAVTSLFHVMSYQNSNQSLLDAMATAANHLPTEGVFLFDFWYGPGVLSDPPEYREKTLEDTEIKVKRIARPTVHANRNVVDVEYDIVIQNKATGHSEVISETHKMRYLFQPELEVFLDISGFELKGFYNWLGTDSPSLKTWNAVAVAQKK